MPIYRTATPADLAMILDWAAAEGWNPGLDDAAAFFAADPEGFFVAEAEGAPVAAISVVNHTDAFAFLGLYIVLPAFRGRRIGIGLWRHALAHAQGRVVGLDGVPDQQANYAASGFTHAGATTRFSGPVTGAVSPDVRQAAPHDLPALMALEAVASGVAKERYMRGWLAGSDTRRTYLLEGGSAFCTARTCRSGAKIGPLVAGSAAEAEVLVRHVAASFVGDMTLDVPGSAGTLAGMCTALGLVPGFHTARMYLGAFTPGVAEVYAVGSLELG